MLLYPKSSNMSYLDLAQSSTEKRLGEKKDCVTGSQLITLGLSRGGSMFVHCSPSALSTEAGLEQR